MIGKAIKRNLHIFSGITSLIAVVAVLLAGGCAPKGEGFSIYLTRGDVSPIQLPVLSHIEIAKEPIIALSDIIVYDAEKHEITLTQKAFERVSALEVPVRGRSFAVTLDRAPVYSGAFWTPISSMSFDGVVIMKPLTSQDTKVIKMELGYPSPSFFKGEDPRTNQKLMKSLEKAGKLKRD